MLRNRLCPLVLRWILRTVFPLVRSRWGVVGGWWSRSTAGPSDMGVRQRHGRRGKGGRGAAEGSSPAVRPCLRCAGTQQRLVGHQPPPPNLRHGYKGKTVRATHRAARGQNRGATNDPRATEQHRDSKHIAASNEKPRVLKIGINRPYTRPPSLFDDLESLTDDTPQHSQLPNAPV